MQHSQREEQDGSRLHDRAHDMVNFILCAADRSEDEWEVADMVDDWMEATPEPPPAWPTTKAFLNEPS